METIVVWSNVTTAENQTKVNYLYLYWTALWVLDEVETILLWFSVTIGENQAKLSVFKLDSTVTSWWTLLPGGQWRPFFIGAVLQEETKLNYLYIYTE